MSDSPSVVDTEREDAYLEMATEEQVWAAWTAQAESGVPDLGTSPELGPQMYMPEQLPLIEDHVPADLVLEDDDLYHPQGPEPGELLTMEKIDALPERETYETANTQADALPDAWTVQNPEVPEDEAEEEEETDLSTMTKAQIQEWADANGYEDVVNMNTMNKDEMIEAITG